MLEMPCDSSTDKYSDVVDPLSLASIQTISKNITDIAFETNCPMGGHTNMKGHRIDLQVCVSQYM